MHVLSRVLCAATMEHGHVTSQDALQAEAEAEADVGVVRQSVAALVQLVQARQPKHHALRWYVPHPDACSQTPKVVSVRLLAGVHHTS